MVQIQVRDEVIEAPVVTLHNLADGTQRGYATGVRFTYRCRTGTKVHTANSVFKLPNEDIWRAFSTNKFNGNVASLTGVYKQDVQGKHRAGWAHS